MRKEKQLFLNLDSDELEKSSSAIKNSALKSNIEKSSLTSILMDRKLNIIMSNFMKARNDNTSCFCKNTDYAQIYDIFNKILEENKKLKTEKAQYLVKNTKDQDL